MNQPNLFPCEYQLYRLNGHTPVPCTLAEWGERLGNVEYIVNNDIVGDQRVTTLFIGSDYCHHASAPELFETKVYNHEFFPYRRYRCATWEEAEIMHQAALALVYMEQQDETV